MKKSLMINDTFLFSNDFVYDMLLRNYKKQISKKNLKKSKGKNYFSLKPSKMPKTLDISHPLITHTITVANIALYPEYQQTKPKLHALCPQTAIPSVDLSRRHTLPPPHNIYGSILPINYGDMSYPTPYPTPYPFFYINGPTNLPTPSYLENKTASYVYHLHNFDDNNNNILFGVTMGISSLCFCFVFVYVVKMYTSKKDKLQKLQRKSFNDDNNNSYNTHIDYNSDFKYL